VEKTSFVRVGWQLCLWNDSFLFAAMIRHESNCHDQDFDLLRRARAINVPVMAERRVATNDDERSAIHRRS
jgi:hypothetical protein